MVTLRSLRTDWARFLGLSCYALFFFPEFEVIDFGLMSPSFQCLSFNDYSLDFSRRCNFPV